MTTLDKFEGKFAISDYNLIPELLVEYLSEIFYDKIENKWVATKRHQLASVSLDAINEQLNSVWEGAGSVDKIKSLLQESRSARWSAMIVKEPEVKTNVPVPTLDSDLKLIDD